MFKLTYITKRFRQALRHRGHRARNSAEEFPGFSECFLTGSAAEVTTISERPMNGCQPQSRPDKMRHAVDTVIQSVTAPHG